MDKVVRIHEKVLDYLIKKRAVDSKLFFVPRKINNQGRLDKGYWFLGNEFYVHISFWEGTDWKEKIHNIGFVILDDKTSYVELSAQDSEEKAKFLEKVSKKLGGFYKHESKAKWYKKYDGTNYIKNLEHFLSSDKLQIDEFLKVNQPLGINLIDDKNYFSYANNIITRRNEQIEYGKTNKVIRICWSTEEWKFPSGSKGKSNSKDSYEHIYGFGHEEWLFDKSKIINGFHYGFLEPLNVTSGKHENKIYNISLYTVNNLNERFFVGEIKNVDCITRQESIDIYKIYEEKGWLQEMKSQVEYVGGTWESSIATSPEIFFNIKFSFKNIIKPDELEKISDEDINLTTYRFKLLPKKTDFIIEIIQEEEELFEGNMKSTSVRKKVFNSESSFDPYHDKMQNAIFDLLKNEDIYDLVKIERDRVDIKARTKESAWHFFELKTDNPKLSIRKAIGQIMEYAYYPSVLKAEKLIIVSDEEPDNDTQSYLNFIRSKFKIPIFYRAFDLLRNEMTNDF
jgi:hypothetical protein